MSFSKSVKSKQIIAKNTLTFALLGDNKVGKSSIIATFGSIDRKGNITSVVPHLHRRIVPMIQSSANFNRNHYELEIFDTPGGDTAFDCRIRHEIYDLDVHLFVLCFAVNDRISFENVRNKWIQEVNEAYSYQKAFIIVATKCDLRDEMTYNSDNQVNIDIVSSEEGRRLAEEVRAIKYYECSAKTTRGIKKVFSSAFEVSVCIEENAIINEKMFKCCLM